MNIAKTTTIVLCALALCTLAACKKGGPEGAAVDAAPQDSYEPPPPPPPLHDAVVDLEGGWKLKVKVPEGFTDDGKGVFQAKGDVLIVRASCTTPCERGAWLAKADTIVAQELLGLAAQDAAGNKIPAQVEYNNRVSENRYEYAVAVPPGGGLLDEPSLAGGVLLFDDAWPKYVVCEWGAALQTAPTFRPALEEACKSLEVLAAAP
jgi:hypothetical protein